MRLRTCLVAIALTTAIQNTRPLISEGYSQDGDKMTRAQRNAPYNYEEVRLILKNAEHAVSEIKKSGTVSKDSFNALLKAWKTCHQLEDVLEGQHKITFSEVFFHPRYGIKAVMNAFTQQQKDELAKNKVMAASQTGTTSGPGSRPVPLVLGRPAQAPEVRFFPEPAVIREEMRIEQPAVRLASSFSRTIDDQAESLFCTRLGDAIKTQLQYGRGSTEAINAGRQIITELSRLLGTLGRDTLGPGYEDIVSRLERGDIIGAYKTGNLVQDLDETLNRIRIDKSTMLISMGGESQRMLLLSEKGTKMYLSGAFTADLLISEIWRARYDETTNDVILSPTGQKTAKSVIRIGPKNTFEFKKGLEVSLAPTAVFPIGVPNARSVRANVQVELKDVSGSRILNVPVYYGALVEYESPDIIKTKVDVGVGIIRTRDANIIMVLDWTQLAHGQKDIPRPSWSISPGVLVKLGEHQIGVRAIAGEGIKGGGVMYTWGPLSLAFDVASVEKQTMGRMPVGGIFGGLTIKVDLPEIQTRRGPE